jgi:hypothetical protein
MGINSNLVRDSFNMCRHCITALKDVLEAKENGELGNTDALAENYTS